MGETWKMLEPISPGGRKPADRMFMSPLTRCGAEAGRVRGRLLREHYVQRAWAGPRHVLCLRPGGINRLPSREPGHG